MFRGLIVLAATLALALNSSAVAKDTGKGTKCGDSYIAAGKTCHKPAPTPAPMCKTGKACGKTCIAKEKVCHIK